MRSTGKASVKNSYICKAYFSFWSIYFSFTSTAFLSITNTQHAHLTHLFYADSFGNDVFDSVLWRFLHQVAEE